MNWKRRICTLLLALSLVVSLGVSAYASSPGGNGGYVDHKGCTDVVPTVLKGDVMWTLPLNEQIQEAVNACNPYEYREFRVLDDCWYRITPCFKLNWGFNGLQQYCVVAKKGNDYVIWTSEQLSDEEQYAVYKSFSTHVNGMFGAEFKNCQFMYLNGNTLNGVTIRDDYILFDKKAVWSLYAVGAYIPSKDVPVIEVK